MANEAGQAWRDIKYLASTMRGLLALEEELTRAGDLDKYRVEKEAQIAALSGKLDELQGQVGEVEATAAAKIASAEAAAKRVLDEAASMRTNAEMAVKQARDEAAKIQQDADVQAKTALATWRDKIAVAKAEYADMQAAVDNAKGLVDAANADLADIKQQHAGVVAEIDRLKAKFGGR